MDKLEQMVQGLHDIISAQLTFHSKESVADLVASIKAAVAEIEAELAALPEVAPEATHEEEAPQPEVAPEVENPQG